MTIHAFLILYIFTLGFSIFFIKNMYIRQGDYRITDLFSEKIIDKVSCFPFKIALDVASQ